MNEDEQDAILGKTVRELQLAKNKRACLERKRANFLRFLQDGINYINTGTLPTGPIPTFDDMCALKETIEKSESEIEELQKCLESFGIKNNRPM